MKRDLFMLARLGWVALACVALSASTTPVQLVTYPATDSSTVRVDVVVSNPQGHAIAGLQRTDFELHAGGSRQVPISVDYRPFKRGDASPIITEDDAIRAARQPGTRVFAFLLDEPHVSAGANAELVRRTVADFIDEKLDGGDLVAVMRPSDSAASLRFTRDRALAHGVIANFRGRKGDDDLRPGRTVTALRELAVRVGNLAPERPLIVVFSEGLARNRPASTGARDDLDDVLRVASRFHETIYTFNPDPGGNADGAETLRRMARQTGGRATSADRFLQGVARLFHDPEGYYAVRYRAAEPDGQFHAVEVRTHSANSVVLGPAGYWTMTSNDWQQIVSAAAVNDSPLNARELRRSPLIDTWTGIQRQPSGDQAMTVTWEPRLPGGARPASVRVRAKSAGGVSVFDGYIAPVGNASPGVSDSARFKVSSGRVEVDMTVFDSRGTLIDTNAQDVDVPDEHLSGGRGPSLLPPRIIRMRKAVDVSATDASQRISPAATRTFTRTDRLLILVPALDSSGDLVHITARLLNRDGATMRMLDHLRGADGDPAAFALPLASLGAGEYQLDFAATSPGGRVGERLSFRVTW